MFAPDRTAHTQSSLFFPTLPTLRSNLHKQHECGPWAQCGLLQDREWVGKVHLRTDGSQLQAAPGPITSKSKALTGGNSFPQLSLASMTGSI